MITKCLCLLFIRVLGDEYYRLTDELLVDVDYPKSISDVWKGLPWNQDAAFQWHDGKTYFIKGIWYYQFDDDKFEVRFNS